MRRAIAVTVCACGAAPPPAVSTPACPAHVPAELAPAANQELAFVLVGRGVQHYACADAGWTLVAPEAELFEGDRAVGTHAAGPTWRDRDGSSVVGRKVAAATVDPTAIPWFLLEVASHGAEAGRMADITAIQRLETVGGLAPATGCDTGAKHDAPYSARYFFYRTSAHAAPACGR